MTGSSAHSWLWAPDLAQPLALSAQAAREHVPQAQVRVAQTLIDHAPFAQHGNLRVWHHWLQRDAFMPPGVARYSTQGRLVAELISQWQMTIAGRDLGGERIESPTLYRWDAGAPLPRLAGRFSDRLYHAAGSLVLKYGADPGYFGFLGSRQLSRRHLPLRVFELSKGFRRSQAGELRGIERLAEFDILEHHTLLAASEALQEYHRQLTVQLDRHADFADGLICYFRTTEPPAGFARNPAIRAAAQRIPTVIEHVPASANYWALTHTLYTSEGISTFHSQLDRVNAHRFGVAVPGVPDLAVIHTALGSIQHMMLLAESRGLRRQPRELPLWLTPVQVRLIPVEPGFVPQCVSLRGSLGAGVRADIDDRPRTVGWRVRRASDEWIPYTVVVGADDNAAGLRVRRRDGSMMTAGVATLAGWVTARGAGYPWVPLGYELVSRRAPLGSHLD